jgi:kinetochore protein Mis13/DSN1
MGEGSAAVLAARHIQEQVLKEFSERSELSDWFARAPGEKKVVVVPNPLNVGNAARVAELEERVKRYVYFCTLFPFYSRINGRQTNEKITD